VNVSQIFAVDRQRLGKQIGRLDAVRVREILDGIQAIREPQEDAGTETMAGRHLCAAPSERRRHSSRQESNMVFQMLQTTPSIPYCELLERDNPGCLQQLGVAL